MNVNVLLSSGEVDEWTGADDAVIVDGYLHVLGPIEEEGTKTFDLSREIERPAMRPMVKTVTHRLVAMYAPNMWMKVEYR